MVYIPSLNLINFRQYSSKTFEFGKINVIKGAPDSGKSTILKALDILLRNYPGEGYDYFIKVGEEEFTIEAPMMHRGEELFYSITNAKGKTTQRTLEYNGKTYKNTGAVAQMADILNPVLLEYSSILPQKGKDNVLIETKAKKTEKLKKLFEISHLDSVSANLKIEQAELEQEVKDLKKEIDTLEALVFEYQDVPIVPDITTIKKEYEELSKEKELFDLKDKAYQEYLAKKKEYENAQNELATLKIEIDTIGQSIKEQSQSIKPVPDFNIDEYYTTKNELESIEQKKLQAEKDKKAYQTYVEQKTGYEEKIQSYAVELESLPLLIPVKQLEFTVEDIKNKEKELSDLEYDLKDFQKQLVLAENGHCPECGQDYCVDVSAIKEKIQKIIQTKDLLEKEILQMQTEWQAYQEQTKENEKAQTKRDSLIDKKKEYENILANIAKVDEPDKVDFTRKSLILSNKLKTLEQAKQDKEQTEKENAKIDEAVQSLKTQLISIKANESVYEKVKEPIEVDSPGEFDLEKYNEISRQLIVNEEQVRNRDRIIEENAKTRERQEKNQSTILEKIKEMEDKEFLRKVKADARKVVDSKLTPDLMAKGTSYLQAKMNEFFQKNAPQYDIKFEKDMSIWFKIEDTWLPLEHFSGFREDLVRLSFMRANATIEHSGILIMDEGEASADIESSTRLFDIILDDPELEQLFAITHKAETIDYLVNEYGANVIEVG